ncbi:hypothetical protein HN385_06595 [archaeon]|nr:hypothetical protein [archaeon]MBT7193764.1 hypothetical protein [archaeon]MBT7507990.1 hypothetical protein [archaeon]
MLAINNSGDNTTLEILSVVGLNVDDYNINLGSGYVNSTQYFATIDTSGIETSHWLNETGNLIVINDKHTLNNTGDTNVNVTVSMNDYIDAEDWICGASGSTCLGDNARVEVKIEENDGDSCINGGQTNYTVLANHSDKSTILLCDIFLSTAGINVFDVYYKLQVPMESLTGTKEASFTYTVTGIV